MSRKKDLAYYLTLPYNIDCTQHEDSDGTRYWLASYPDIMGCSSDGSTRIEAVNNVKELFKEMVEVILESGKEVPVPKKVILEAVTVIIGEPTQSISAYFHTIAPVKPELDKPLKKKSDIAESSETSYLESKRPIIKVSAIPA